MAYARLGMEDCDNDDDDDDDDVVCIITLSVRVELWCACNHNTADFKKR